MKITKNRKQMLNNFDTSKIYEPLEAIKILKEKSFVKFKETIDISINLGIDSNKTDQNIKGVVIVDVKAGSVGAEKGLKKGDVIIQINRIKISSTDELYKLNEEAKKANKTSILMLILRNGMRRFIGLPTQ